MSQWNRAGEPSGSIDLAHLTDATAGDEELARELLTLFEGQARELVRRLGGALDDRERRELVHTLKGSAAAIGAVAVARAAEACEAALAGGAPSDAPLDALRRAVEETLTAIAALERRGA
jgi:HPt (histidine-containing phosphotransfer) domain-containing protein